MGEYKHPELKDQDFAQVDRIIAEHAKKYPNHLAVIRERRCQELAAISDNVARALVEARSDDELIACYPKQWA